MKFAKERVMTLVVIVFALYGSIAGCTHDDEVLASSGPDITRGNLQISIGTAGTTFDKAHSNVQWASQYLGSTALLTGRFDNFGFDQFDFNEQDGAGIRFQAWVWLNTVNTSEPGRDDGCLLGTLGTTGGATTDPSNLAVIKSKSVELSTTDKGYNVTCDLTFHGVTKEVVAKMSYDGTAVSGTNNVYGFSLQFQFLAKTDFLIVSNNIGDNVDVRCNATLRRPQ